MSIINAGWIKFCQGISQHHKKEEKKTGGADEGKIDVLHSSFRLSFPEPYRPKAEFSPSKALLLKTLLGNEWFELWNATVPAVHLSVHEYQTWKYDANKIKEIQRNIQCWVSAPMDTLDQLTVWEWYILLSNCVTFNLSNEWTALYTLCHSLPRLKIKNWSVDEEALFLMTW